MGANAIATDVEFQMYLCILLKKIQFLRNK